MQTFTTTIAAAALILTGAGSARANCPSPREPMQVGAVSRNPEKDTFGSACTVGTAEQTGSIAAQPRPQVMQIGTRTGEAEKDTFGYGRAVNNP